MTKTSIEWADEVWNPVTGCTKVSQGCKNCYAERIANRFWGERKFTDLQMHPERLEDPLHWKKPRRVFVNSMSDLFHVDVDHEFISDVFRIMERAISHTFMVLTKRPKEMLHWFNTYNAENPLPNVWLGVSAEDQNTTDERIPDLLRTPAAVRFVSCEPLLGPVNLSPWIDWRLSHIDSPQKLDWIICGGESGPNARPMNPDWARSLRDQCVAAEVPFFFKQFGEWYPSPYQGKNTDHDGHEYDKGTDTVRLGKKAAGRLLDGREWEEWRSRWGAGRSRGG